MNTHMAASCETVPLKQSSSRGRPALPSRPSTPLRSASRASLRGSDNHAAAAAAAVRFPLDELEPAFAELSGAMAGLEANFLHLQLMHMSLARFSENFASFLYGLNMNAFCVDFPETPLPDSFTRMLALQQQESANAPSSLAALTAGGHGAPHPPLPTPGKQFQMEGDSELTFLTTDTSFVENPPLAAMSSRSSRFANTRATSSSSSSRLPQHRQRHPPLQQRRGQQQQQQPPPVTPAPGRRAPFPPSSAATTRTMRTVRSMRTTTSTSTTMAAAPPPTMKSLPSTTPATTRASRMSAAARGRVVAGASAHTTAVAAAYYHHQQQQQQQQQVQHQRHTSYGASQIARPTSAAAGSGTAMGAGGMGGMGGSGGGGGSFLATRGAGRGRGTPGVGNGARGGGGGGGYMSGIARPRGRYPPR